MVHILTSLPSGFLITTPSTTGDFLASACAYSGPTVYTCEKDKKSQKPSSHHKIRLKQQDSKSANIKTLHRRVYMTGTFS